MPNDFRHQAYAAGPPRARYRLVEARAAEVGSAAEAARLSAAGRALREAGVSRVYLVHGTFAGTDALGFFHRIARFAPDAAAWLRETRKATFDRLSRDAGNYPAAYADDLEARLNDGSAGARIDVERFLWSSENHHLGRAHAAVDLCETLLDAKAHGIDRVLLWGHSHAGNVFALLTNILGAGGGVRARFFRAGRCVDRTRWDRVRARLDRGDPAPVIDVATFGTPIRYGWETGVCATLLHVVHHRPAPGHPEYKARFPPTKEDVVNAAHGDCMQQLGIAGTNLPPGIFAFLTWRADRRIGRLVQPGIRRRDLVAHLRTGVRVADAGETLLVDYGEISGHVGRHLAGHAVYTRRRWLAFHAEEVAGRIVTG